MAIQHVNVIRCFGMAFNAVLVVPGLQNRNVAYIALEFINGGNLRRDWLFFGGYSENTTRFIIKQLLEGLREIHNRGFAHREIKPENLLFDENFTLKIVGFSFARRFNGDNQDGVLHTNLGNSGYRAPEMMISGANGQLTYDGQQADLFAAAVIMFNIRAGR